MVLPRERDEAPIRVGKDLEHPANIGFELIRDNHLVDWAAGVLRAFAKHGHRQKSAPYNAFLIAAEAVLKSFGLICQRAADAAKFVDGVRGGDALGEPFPDAGQYELQSWQGALAAYGLLDEQVDRSLVNVSSPTLRRLDNGTWKLGFLHDGHDHVLA